MRRDEIISKVTRFGGPLVAMAGATAWFQPAVAGSDLWWHLASGRNMVERAEIPTVDPFSHTFAGEAWTNHEWLWDLLFWNVYRLDPQFVPWLNLAVITAAFGFSFWVARRFSGSTLAAGCVLWLAAASSHWFLDIRPHVFTLFGVGVLLLTREARWARYLWPAMIVVWVNLHGGYSFAIGLIGLHVLIETLELSWAARRLTIPWGDWLSVALCFAAVAANPFGREVIDYPVAYLDSGSVFRQLIEWHPPRFSFDVFDFESRFFALAALAALGAPFALRRGRFYIALAGVTFAMAWTSRRFIPLFDLTAAPLAALGLAIGLERARKLWPRLREPLAGAAVTLAAAALAFWVGYGVRLTPHFLERWTESHLYPDAAVQYLKALGPPERLLNYYNWGGFLMLHLPESKVFVDGRANTLYGERFYLKYLKLSEARPGYRAVLARHPVDAAILPSSGALARKLATQEPAWPVVYQDLVATILLPPNSPLLGQSLPDPAAVVGDHPGYVSEQARAARRREDLERAEMLFEQSIARNPLIASNYDGLAMLAAQRGSAAEIERAIQRGIDAYPRGRRHFACTAVRAYHQIGELGRALVWLRSCRAYGPFSGNRHQTNARFRGLEAALELQLENAGEESRP